MTRIVEIVGVRAGYIIKSGKAWARQQKLLQRLAKPRGRK